MAQEEDHGDETDPAHRSRFDASGHWSEPPRSFAGLNPERIFAGRQLWNHVRDMIDKRPPAQKAVLIMRDVEGHDALKTCELLELGPENQRVMLHRARTRIRNEIETLQLGKNADNHASVKKML